jgi:protein-L-isoaspartate O-methyltransferase
MAVIRKPRASGVGMTSDRTRLRMVERLRAAGIQDEVVLGAMGAGPRHLFIEEALASGVRWRTAGEIEAVRGVGPTAPATKRGRSRVENFPHAALASLAASRLNS